MKRYDIPGHSKESTTLASLVILACLAFQTVASFRLFCPPKSLQLLSTLRMLCAPALYPFLDYPM